MKTWSDNIKFDVEDGLLTLEVSHYMANAILEAMQATIRVQAYKPATQPEFFAHIHRLSRMAYEVSKSRTVKMIDSLDRVLLASLKASSSLLREFQEFIGGPDMPTRLRAVTDEDVMSAYEGVMAVHTVMDERA